MHWQRYLVSWLPFPKKAPSVLQCNLLTFFVWGKGYVYDRHKSTLSLHQLQDLVFCLLLRDRMTYAPSALDGSSEYRVQTSCRLHYFQVILSNRQC